MDLLTTSRELKGYDEEIIILKETNDLFKYSLSNYLYEIENAILDRTGYYIDLYEAKWKFNSGLSKSVKYLMISHNVIYSMTIDTKNKYLIVNMRIGRDEWLITGYEEIGGHYFNFSLIETFRSFCKLLDKENNEDE